MLRGLRWQLFALIAAASLFLLVFLTRPTNPAPVVQGETAVPTVIVEPTIVEPTIVPVESTPLPLLQPETSSDGVTTYREALIGRVQRLNPLLADFNPVDADITSLIFEGLIKINEHGEPVGGLAKSWIVSSDGLEYVFTLRDDVLWQDGTRFTSADVAFTMSLLRSPEFSGPESLGQFWRTIETEPLSDKLVRFRLAQPLGGFLEALRIGIVPQHALQGTSSAQLPTHLFTLSPIGTGPYQLETIRADENGVIRAVDLRVAPVYRQRVEGRTGFALDRVSFRLYDTFDEAFQALQNGEVDGLAGRNQTERRPLLQRAQSGDIKIRNGIEPTVGMLIFNWANDDFPVFREQRVRLALETGLGRDSIIERHLLNMAVRADSPILLNSWAYEPNLAWPVYNVPQAQSLLSNARINIPTPEPAETADPNATEEAEAQPTVAPTEAPQTDGLFAFTILTPDNPALVAVAQEIAAQWGLLDIQVNVEAVDLATYRTRLESHDFQAALVELSNEGSADPDVYPFWHQGQYPDGKNYGGADSRAISELLESARRDPTSLNRKHKYQEFQREFVRQAIALPLYYPLFTYAFALDVNGVQLGFIGKPSDRFMTIQNWTMDS